MSVDDVHVVQADNLGTTTSQNGGLRSRDVAGRTGGYIFVSAEVFEEF